LIAEPFPLPDISAQAISRALTGRIEAAIDRAGGWIAFEPFMQTALFEPGLGYYSGTSIKFGAGGDFTTGPMLGDWLAAALAPFLATQFAALGCARVLEFGAGTGRLAGQLLAKLADRGCADVEYSIVEVSADLRQRQQAHLAKYGQSVRWLDRLPGRDFHGVAFANEVVDAFPVMRFVKQSGAVLPLGVVRSQGGLALAPGPADARLSAAVAEIEAEIGHPLPEGYRSEVCLLLQPWLEEVLGSFGAGGLLLIDYGLPRRDYYRAERADGTLICHYRQRAADPYSSRGDGRALQADLAHAWPA
jgi:SAM-dependent MidA family methyltransferase